MMWTVRGDVKKRRAELESDWERAERKERMRHAKWLVEHGARPSVVARETGMCERTLRRAAKKRRTAC